MYCKHIPKSLACLAALSAGLLTANAQNDEKAYNISRAQEALDQNRYEEAAYYVDLEIKSNPNNAYAYVARGRCNDGAKNFGNAISDYTKAIRLFGDDPKCSEAYNSRSGSYWAIGDTLRSISDVSRSIELNPKNAKSYWTRAWLFVQCQRFREAEADCKKSISLAADEKLKSDAKMTLARVYLESNENSKGFDLCNELVSETHHSGRSYALRAKAHAQNGRTEAALSDLSSAVREKQDLMLLRLIVYDLVKQDADVTIATLKNEAKPKREDGMAFAYLLYEACEEAERYDEAVAAIIPWAERFAFPMAHALVGAGHWGRALEWLEHPNASEWQTPGTIMGYKAAVFMNNGEQERAMEAFAKAIELDPANAYAYYQRAFARKMTGDMEGALQDCDIALALSPDDAQSLVTRGGVLLKLGRKEDAFKDFRTALQVAQAPAHKAYAHLFLGETKQAEALVSDVVEAKEYYDAACLCSLLGKREDAVRYLRLSFEKKHWRDFVHIQQDDDLDNIREMQEFKDLIQEFQQKATDEMAAIDALFDAAELSE